MLLQFLTQLLLRFTDIAFITIATVDAVDHVPFVHQGDGGFMPDEEYIQLARRSLGQPYGLEMRGNIRIDGPSALTTSTVQPTLNGNDVPNSGRQPVAQPVYFASLTHVPRITDVLSKNILLFASE